MAGFFAESFLLQPAEQPTAAEMASLEGKTLKLGGFSVLGTPSWQTVGLLDGYKEAWRFLSNVATLDEADSVPNLIPPPKQFQRAFDFEY